MISNATPLIILSKINQLILLRKLYGKILIPDAVKKEVLYNDKLGSELIRQALEERWLLVKNPKENLALHLGKGETAAISLAKEENQPLLLDDGRAVKAARMYNLEVFRTTSVLFLAYQKKFLSRKEVVELLNGLLEQGYYLKPTVYAQLLERLR